MKTAALVLGLFLYSVPCSAEWFWLFGVGGPNQKTYIDKSTLRVDGDERRIWQLTSFDQQDRFGTQSFKALVVYDCADQRTKLIQMVSYAGPMGSGKSESAANPVDWSYPPPDSVGHFMLRIVCALPAD